MKKLRINKLEILKRYKVYDKKKILDDKKVY